MRIRFDDITDEGLHIDVASAEFQSGLSSIRERLPKEVTLEDGLKGGVDISLSEGDVILSADVIALVRLECSRCLQTYVMSAELKPTVVIRRRTPEDLPSEMDDPDSNVVFGDEEGFEVAEILAQELMLELPMKPLCGEECPGLCPQCGNIKGSADCACSSEPPVDPRWRALADLKKRVS